MVRGAAVYVMVNADGEFDGVVEPAGMDMVTVPPAVGTTVNV